MLHWLYTRFLNIELVEVYVGLSVRLLILVWVAKFALVFLSRWEIGVAQDTLATEKDWLTASLLEDGGLSKV
jgi:hypothetical protein